MIEKQDILSLKPNNSFIFYVFCMEYLFNKEQKTYKYEGVMGVLVISELKHEL